MAPLIATAKAFYQRPSTLLAIEDPVLALNFDLAATAVLARLKQEAEEDR
jgi:ABC-type phosphate/phosphonate transport system ATPase subunit